MERKYRSTFFKRRPGFTLSEIVVVIVIFGILLTGVLSISSYLVRLTRINLGRSTALAIAQEYLEITRNLPYDQVGSDVTFPTGSLPSSFTVSRNGITFHGKIIINFVDDPADLLACTGAPPCDTVPADYKKVEVQVCLDEADCARPVALSSSVVPAGVESAPNTGSLFITVVDAGGQAVPSVGVTVTNSTTGPPVNISNTTDINGKLQLLSLPPAANSYHVTVSKNGYTTSGTITPSVANPNPVLADTSIVVESVTSVTLAIDLVSTLAITTLAQDTCNAVGSLTMHLRGEQLIGTTPDVYLVDQDIALNASGQATLDTLPWDNYTLTMVSATHDVAGINPPDSIVLNPGGSMNISIVTAPHQSSTLRVIVRDSGTDAPLANASVQVTDGGSYDETKITDQGTVSQTDWSGGPGQATFTDPTKFASHSGAPDTATTPGQVSIAYTVATPTINEPFDTDTAKDGVTTTANWDTAAGQVQLPTDLFAPGQYVSSAQAQTLKLNGVDGRITKATLTATATLNGQMVDYSLASDGIHFEVVTLGVEHTFADVGTDLRWRATLQTSDTSITPVIDSLSLTYTQEQRPDLTATITSSTYDNGAATNFVNLTWTPTAQPAPTGATPVRFQAAANNDDATWNYLGPDGTASTYFTASGTSLPASLNGNRYLRYKLWLSTDDATATPTISYAQIIKNNACTPPGQVFFSPMTDADYTINVTLTGYQSSTDDVTINGQTLETIELVPS